MDRQPWGLDGEYGQHSADGWGQIHVGEVNLPMPGWVDAPDEEGAGYSHLYYPTHEEEMWRQDPSGGYAAYHQIFQPTPPDTQHYSRFQASSARHGSVAHKTPDATIAPSSSMISQSQDVADKKSGPTSSTAPGERGQSPYLLDPTYLSANEIFNREWASRGLSCAWDAEELAGQVSEIKINHPGIEYAIGSMASTIVGIEKSDDENYRKTYHMWMQTYRGKKKRLLASYRKENYTPEETRLALLANFRNCKRRLSSTRRGGLKAHVREGSSSSLE